MQKYPTYRGVAIKDNALSLPKDVYSKEYLKGIQR